MGYYVRTLCTSSDVPKLSEVHRWLRSRGSKTTFKDVDDLESPEWEQLSLFYKDGKLPILVECNRDTGEDDCLLREECREFLEFVEDAADSEAKKKVVAHIAATRFIIACQLPTSDIDDDGYAANAAFLNYFVEQCGGMMQADGEGFYEGHELILELK